MEPTRSAVLLCALATVGLLGYLRSRRAYREGQPLAAAVIVGAMIVLVSPISWSHHQTALAVAAACAVSAVSRTATWIWSVLVLLLVTVPFQLLLNRSWPAGQPVTDSILVVLALLIVIAVPFRSAPAGNGPAATAQPRATIRAMSSANRTSESSTGA